jgi:predicted nucleic acid-binding protein
VIANEPEKAVLIDLTEGVDLIAPPSVHWEISNAFSAMLRRKRITLHHALQAIGIYRQIPIRYTEVELKDSLRIAAEYDLYAYDAYLIRCALKHKAPLLTLDEKLWRAAVEAGVRVIEVKR